MGELHHPAAGLLAATRRRNLTILFADLSDSTRIAAAMEAEDYAALLADIRRSYELAIPRHEGTIVRIHGDGLLAVFGYPQAREDDGRRATEAALDLHAMVRAMHPVGALPAQTRLSLHTGIHAGLVLLQDGDSVLGRFELLGNAANIAARLSDCAAADEILVSRETLGAESHFFETGPLRYLDLKGRDERIAVHAILARTPVRTRFEARTMRGLTPFVGRAAELRRLQHGLDTAMAGKPAQFVLLASPGVGKTRLAEAFLQRAAAAGCQIHRGYCESHLSAEPLQPFLQMLRALFRVTHDMSAADAALAIEARLRELDPALLVHAPELLRALSFAAADASAKRPAAERTMLAMRELFERLVAHGPTLLFIDDWQWTDDASSQMLALVRGLEGALFVLLAARDVAPGAATMAEAELLSLTPFSEAEATQTIGTLLPRTDPFLLAEIQRYAGGNPLFIEELCHSAANEDIDRRMVRMHGGAAWLNVLVESRVARLPDAQAELVRAAAIIGNVIPCWLLESLTGCHEHDPRVHALAEQDFIFPGETAGTLRFKHGLTRDVIYDSVGLHQRRTLHGRIAEALRKHRAANALEDAYEALAYHYAAAGHWAEAARHAERAGDKAVAVSALDRAKTQYRAALAALDALPPSPQHYERWMAISQRLGLVCVFDASRADLALFERAVTLASDCNDPAALARAQYWLGYITYSLGEAPAAIRHCELALAAAEGVGDDPLTVQIRATLGQALTAAGAYDAALPLLDDAIAIKRRHRSGTRANVGLAFSLVCRACILGDRGAFSAASECFDEALAAIQGVTHEIGATIRGWRSAILLWQGHWEEARVAAVESARIAEQTRSLFQFAIGRAMDGYAQWMLTQDPAALDGIADATSWVEAREGGLYKSLNHGWLADGLVSTGRIVQARHHAARALARSRKRDLIGVAMAYRALARAAADERDLARSRHYLGLALKTADARGSAHEAAVTQLCEAAIELTLGDRRRAAALLDRALPALERMDMAWHLAEARRLRADT